MRHEDRSRAVTPVLGAVLLFGIVMLTVGVVQVLAVPSANEKVEYTHNQQVQTEMHEFESAVLLSASRGASSTVSVTPGTKFPTRPGLVNPTAASGSIRTVDLGPIVVENAVGDGEAGDYLDGGQLSYETRALVYSPAYREYEAAPETVFEHALLYNDFGGETQLLESERTLVVGNRLTLFTLDGDLAVGGVDPMTLTVRPVSAPGKQVSIRDDGVDPVTLKIPTALSAATWETLLAEEQEAVGGNIRNQTYLNGGPDASSTLVLELVPGKTYQLTVVRVGIGTGDTADPTPAMPVYVVDYVGNDATVSMGKSHDAVVEVRDAFNNPVPNALVSVSTQPTYGTVAAKGNPTETQIRTDEFGRATFEYQAPDAYYAASETFEFSVGGVTGNRGTATYTVSQKRPFDVRIEDGVVVSSATAARVTLVGTAITDGANGPNVPVSVEVHVGADSLEPWPHDVNDQYMSAGGKRYYSVTDRENGVSVAVTAASYKSNGAVRHSVSSDESMNALPDNVDVFLRGDVKPDYPGFANQADAEEYLADYINPDNTINIDENEAIFLFELGTTDTTSSAADFQDAVVLVTFMDDGESP